MASRIHLAAFVWILMFCPTVNAQRGSDVKTKRIETCEHFCWALILEGRLIDTFEFSRCDAISGMTCHITLKDGARLPSRVFVQALDSRDKPLGKRLLLIYPELKPKEGGWATFPLRIPNSTKTVVLTGEWNGAYRSAY
jgi:hypothetical protein